MQVCYDLRFPVWCRNINNEYDLLIFMANWPLSRRNVWLTLLQARSIETSSYVIGVNRIGSDPLGNNYSGDSMIVDMKGKIVCQAAFNEECIITYKLRKQDLIDFRNKFPVHLDADIFYFNNQNEL